MANAQHTRRKRRALGVQVGQEAEREVLARVHSIEHHRLLLTAVIFMTTAARSPHEPVSVELEVGVEVVETASHLESGVEVDDAISPEARRRLHCRQKTAKAPAPT